MHLNIHLTWDINADDVIAAVKKAGGANYTRADGTN